MPFNFPDNNIPLESQVPPVTLPQPPTLTPPAQVEQGAEPPKLPWDQNSRTNSESKFFPPIDIDTDRWDALFPYRLLVIDSKTNGIIQGDPEKPEIAIFEKGSVESASKGTSSYLIDYSTQTRLWTMRLAISPQQLTIQDQFSIQTTATLKGILEEHSGVRFKTINAQGTFGVWPLRSTIDDSTKRADFENFFSGFVSAAQALSGSITGLFNLVSGNYKSSKPKTLRPGDSFADEANTTGYYQALKLQQFLEQYAEAKRNPKNANWRLVFDIPKQNQSFVVTPIAYSWQQNANRPMEINFNFQLKAWRRIALGFDKFSAPGKPAPTLNTGTLSNVLNTIDNARRVISNTVNLIKAIRSDFQKIFDVIRRTALFIKDLIGAVKSITDLPGKILNDLKSTIAESLKILKSSISNDLSDSKSIGALNSITSSSRPNEGLSRDAVSGGQIGSSAANASSLDPSNNVFNEPEKFYDLLKNVPISGLSISDSQSDAISGVIDDARNTTVDQLKNYRALILELCLQLSNNFGSNDSYYNKIYKKSYSNYRTNPVTLDEYDILKAFYDLVSAYDLLTATIDVNSLNTQNTLDYVAGLASNSKINFNIPTSKKLMPVPFGLTIEQISARYLKDPSRWLEIATLNGLRDPYIDEDGFQLKLLSNGIDRQIIVNNSDNLYIGQTVVLKSQTQQASARTILNIERLSDTSYLITLDGLADLNSFKLSEDAYLQAYLPGTINSQQKIFIPSNKTATEDQRITPPSVTLKDPLSSVSKVDWLIQENGDLAINNYGDFRYSYGMTNIIQALRIKLGTEVGKVLIHPDFGLPIKPGTSTSDTVLKEIYNSISKMIKQDSRFSGISKLQLLLTRNTLTINLAVSIPGQTGIFPVSFEFAK